MNILFITLDQFRGDCYGAAGHPFVTTPTLDQWAREGQRLTKHYSQSAPCSPGRAALYTGTYQMNNRVVANGTPHPQGLANVTDVLRAAGYDPTLFGYTDQGLHPRAAVGEDDPRLDNYDGILPGFSIGLYMPEDQGPWVRWLRSQDYDVPLGFADALRGEPTRPAEVSLTSFTVQRFLDWLHRQESGWCAHLSLLRPHPPYAAAGAFSTVVDPDAVSLPIPPVAEAERHPLHTIAMATSASAAPTTEAGQRYQRAQYYGMINEVDVQLGRVDQALRDRGEREDTLIIVVSDHGEQLGDHGLQEKLAFFPQSYHIIGIWRDPRRSPGVVDAFTENVDVVATLADTLGVPCPRSVDGRSWLPLFDGSAREWRTAAHYEWDWRYFFINDRTPRWPAQRQLSMYNLATIVSDDFALVAFGDGELRGFDLAADPTWRTPLTDDSRQLAAASELLAWRAQHLRRDDTDLLLSTSRAGHWPSP
jgi:arylsulfatase A-like enzyme